MTRTVAEAVEQARFALNDDEGLRAGDDEMVKYAREAVVHLRRERPDLFLGNWAAVPVYALTTVLPLTEDYFIAVCDYIAARASIKDDEHVNSGRVQLLATLLEATIK